MEPNNGKIIVVLVNRTHYNSSYDRVPMNHLACIPGGKKGAGSTSLNAVDLCRSELEVTVDWGKSGVLRTQETCLVGA